MEKIYNIGLALKKTPIAPPPNFFDILYDGNITFRKLYFSIYYLYT